VKGKRISVTVSPETKESLERYVRATGIAEGLLVEEALRHHRLALHELPADVIVHPRLVVTRRSGEEILERLRSRCSTPALRELMTRDGD
jgi:hypothetical protein